MPEQFEGGGEKERVAGGGNGARKGTNQGDGAKKNRVPEGGV